MVPTILTFFSVLTAVAAQHHPPGGECERVLYAECERERHDSHSCHDCIREHIRTLERAHCERDELERFCGGAEDRCYQELRDECPLYRHATKAQCTECAKRVATRAHCTANQTMEYCDHVHPGPPGPPTPGGKTIVDLAIATPDLSTLVTALKAGSLVATLSGKGPFTVFAPTNEAFAALPAGVLASLLKRENKKKLDDVLTYHVVAGAVHAKDLKDGEKVKTVEGEELTVRISGGNVYINKAKVTTANVDASNGVVHIIDGVLLPGSGPAPPSPPTPPTPPTPPSPSGKGYRCHHSEGKCLVDARANNTLKECQLIGCGAKPTTEHYTCDKETSTCKASTTSNTTKAKCEKECGTPAPPAKAHCTSSQYCCPDAKHCLTPVANKTCATDPEACSASEVCCPLTKLCVVVGDACAPTAVCPATSYCCPDALHCLTPVKPGTLCDPKAKAPCSGAEVCCPLTKECVDVGAVCKP